MNRSTLFGVLCWALVAGSPQVPQFRAVVKEVRVDVLVTRNGDPVTGLTQADFEVRDNGAVQKINALTSEDLPVNVVLALDASSSVKGERLSHLQQAGHVDEGADAGDPAERNLSALQRAGGGQSRRYALLFALFPTPPDGRDAA